MTQKKNLQHMNRHARQRGFSLVELGVVMILSGIFLVAGFEMYNTYLKDRRMRESYEKQMVVQGSLDKFSLMQGRYPCPAPRVPQNHPRAGLEDCRLFTDPAFSAQPEPCLDPNDLPSTFDGVCKAFGRDTEQDGDNDPDMILIGVVPWRTIREGIEDETCFTLVIVNPGLPNEIPVGGAIPCEDPPGTPNPIPHTSPNEGSISDISMESGYDPWGYQMTYAVTANMTIGPSIISTSGAISVVMEDNTSLVRPPDSVHYVLIGHGENHKGTFNRDGNAVDATCTPTTGDAENCDLDALFVSGLRNIGDTAAYFDDTVLFKAFSLSQLWQFAGVGSETIYNTNPGNVGVGTTADPSERFEVEGNLRASGNSMSTRLCDPTGNECWAPDILGSAAGISCRDKPVAPGFFRLMTGIKDGDVTCSDPLPLPTLIPGQSCATAGEYMVGINLVTGAIICDTP